MTAMRHSWAGFEPNGTSRASAISDPELHRVRAARRRYWAARAAGEPAEIERALREWVEAQLIAADAELSARERGDSRSGLPD
jgi:hypothetical protein